MNCKSFNVDGSGISFSLDQDKCQEDPQVKYCITALQFSLTPNSQAADVTIHHKTYIL